MRKMEDGGWRMIFSIGQEKSVGTDLRSKVKSICMWGKYQGLVDDRRITRSRDV